MKLTETILACDFCGKKSFEVRHLVAGPEPRFPCICQDCITLAAEAIAEGEGSTGAIDG
jgi:ATP-dependent protease Clp ATPase subunit